VCIVSGAQDQDSLSTVICPNCSRENPAERLFCGFCRHRITAESTDGGNPNEEAERSQASLQAAQDENNNLRQQLASTQEELDKVKGAIAQPGPSPSAAEEFQAKLKLAEDRASTLEGRSTEWEKKWKLAEEKAASFEKQVVAKAKEFEARFRQGSGPTPPSNLRPKLIAGALVVVCGLGGYASGRYLQFKADSRGRVSRLSSEVTNAQEQISSLKSSLDAAYSKANQIDNDSKSLVDAANQKISDLTNKLTAREAQQHQIETKLASAQRDLTSTQAQLNAANAKEQSTEAASNQRIQQLQADIQSRDNQISALRSHSAKSSGTTTARTGYLIWSGTVKGNKQTVHLVNGQPDSGTVANGPTGPLPGTACILTTPDPNRVKKMHSGARNQCNQVQFDVYGPGAVQARIDWVSSQ
jgi:septal ring factor EnvC (AmiA/AmiB activator)